MPHAFLPQVAMTVQIGFSIFLVLRVLMQIHSPVEMHLRYWAQSWTAPHPGLLVNPRSLQVLMALVMWDSTLRLLIVLMQRTVVNATPTW